jgi:hypothetical protein
MNVSQCEISSDVAKRTDISKYCTPNLLANEANGSVGYAAVVLLFRER